MRKRLLAAWWKTLDGNADVWADLIRDEIGKPRIEALSGDVISTLDAVRWTVKHGGQALKSRRIAAGWQRFLLMPAGRLEWHPVGVVGMIGTFQAIASTQNRGNTDAILAGVGEALYATAAGLTIAVICFVAYNYFAARLRTITASTEQAATKLINAMVEERHHLRDADTRTNHAEGRVQEQEGTHGVQAKARA